MFVSGEVMKPRAWMLSIEGQVVMGPQANFVNGIAALFVSYYNFNLQYPEEASCTLEFIQRYHKTQQDTKCYLLVGFDRIYVFKTTIHSDFPG